MIANDHPRRELYNLLVKQTEDRIRLALVNLDSQLSELDMTVSGVELYFKDRKLDARETSNLAALDVLIRTMRRYPPKVGITKENDKWITFVGGFHHRGRHYERITIGTHDTLCEAEKAAEAYRGFGMPPFDGIP